MLCFCSRLIMTMVTNEFLQELMKADYLTQILGKQMSRQENGFEATLS